MSALDEIRARIPDVPEAQMSRAEKDRTRLLAAVDALLYIANEKADTSKEVGRWWSNAIKGAIESALERNQA